MIFINNERVKSTLHLLGNLKKSGLLSNKDYKFILESAYHLLSSDDDKEYNLGLSIICHVAEAKPDDIFIHQLLFDCIIESRVFLYHEMFGRVDVNYLNNIGHGALDSFAESFYTLSTGTILTRDQMRLFEDFRKFRRLVVSAPTSFGKSRIVSEIIINGSYNNIAIVLPTIALLNETYLSFRKNPID